MKLFCLPGSHGVVSLHICLCWCCSRGWSWASCSSGFSPTIWKEAVTCQCSLLKGKYWILQLSPAISEHNEQLTDGVSVSPNFGVDIMQVNKEHSHSPKMWLFKEHGVWKMAQCHSCSHRAPRSDKLIYLKINGGFVSVLHGSCSTPVIQCVNWVQGHEKGTGAHTEWSKFEAWSTQTCLALCTQAAWISLLSLA